MNEYMELGPTPCEESCAQIGNDNFREQATKEMECYAKQLYRTFPEAIELGIKFKMKWFAHDFGSYGEVCAYWNPDNIGQDEYIYYIDRNLPSHWDEESLKELNLERK